MTRRFRFAALPLLGVLIASCGRDTVEQRASHTESGTARGTEPPPTLSSDTASREAEVSVELVEAATAVVRFLRGDAPFDSIHVADTVSLYLGQEEGKTRRDVPRQLLRDRMSWKVSSPSLRHSYSFVPPPGSAVLTTRVGRHLKCLDYPLAATFPDLARLPHVGTTLRYGSDSCLQTWNLTLVFQSRERRPPLVAAIYDQFEW